MYSQSWSLFDKRHLFYYGHFKVSVKPYYYDIHIYLLLLHRVRKQLFKNVENCNKHIQNKQNISGKIIMEILEIDKGSMSLFPFSNIHIICFSLSLV